MTVVVTAGPAGEPAVYEEELTGVTNGSGQAWFEPTSCVQRDTMGDFVFTFTVLAVAKEGKLYASGNNTGSQTEHVFVGTSD